MSIFCNNFVKILAKLHPKCLVVYIKSLAMIWRAVRMRRMEEDMQWGRLSSIIMGYKKYRDEHNLEVKRILNGRETRVCMQIPRKLIMLT